MSHKEITSDGVCLIWLDLDSPANAFSPAGLAELAALVPAEARGVVILSAKDRFFSAGADLRALRALSDAELEQFLAAGQALFNRLAKLPAVAAIHGGCVGGGFELALACRYRIASPDRVTRIGLPETSLGILPAWGGATRLPRLIGVPRALDVILAGKVLPAKQALRYGMIDEIAPRESLLPAALRALRRLPAGRMPVSAFVGPVVAPLARRQTWRRTRGHYPAPLKALEVVAAAPWSSLEKSLARERAGVLALAKTDACRNLMRLFFLQEHAKHMASGEFKPVERVAVIGAGVMGAGIAQWLAAHEVRVVLRDIAPDRVAAGLATIEKLLGNRRAFDRLEARDALDRIMPAATEVPLGNVEVVIEAAVEKLDLKKQVFARLAEQAGTAILATNTSALPITEIAGATRDPGRVVGLHFFNPVHKMQLVEVIPGAQTRPDVVHRVVRFAQQIGKLPVVVKDRPGFLVNRILLPYLIEAGRLFEAGAPVEAIDEAMLEFGMPMGPLRLIDEVGVDVAAEVAATLAAAFADRLQVPAVLGRLRTEGWLGKKSGRGFYVGDRPNPELKATGRFGRAELQERLALLLVNEAARCVEEEIAAGPADVDFAMVMGAGFAPFRGGPLRYADALGPVTAAERLSRYDGPQYRPCDRLREGRRFYED